MSQVETLYNLLKDGQPHRTDKIVDGVYGHGLSLARVAARINDLKKRGYLIKGWKDKANPKLYWYQIISSNEEVVTINLENIQNQQMTFFEKVVIYRDPA